MSHLHLILHLRGYDTRFAIYYLQKTSTEYIHIVLRTLSSLYVNYGLHGHDVCVEESIYEKRTRTNMKMQRNKCSTHKLICSQLFLFMLRLHTHAHISLRFFHVDVVSFGCHKSFFKFQLTTGCMLRRLRVKCRRFLEQFFLSLSEICRWVKSKSVCLCVSLCGVAYAIYASEQVTLNGDYIFKYFDLK